MSKIDKRFEWESLKRVGNDQNNKVVDLLVRYTVISNYSGVLASSLKHTACLYLVLSHLSVPV